MGCPRGLRRGVFAAAVERQAATSFGIGSPDLELYPHGTSLREHQGGSQGQFGDRAASHRPRRREGQLQHACARQQHRVEHRMICQPRVLGQRESTPSTTNPRSQPVVSQPPTAGVQQTSTRLRSRRWQYARSRANSAVVGKRRWAGQRQRRRCRRTTFASRRDVPGGAGRRRRRGGPVARLGSCATTATSRHSSRALRSRPHTQPPGRRVPHPDHTRERWSLPHRGWRRRRRRSGPPAERASPSSRRSPAHRLPRPAGLPVTLLMTGSEGCT